MHRFTLWWPPVAISLIVTSCLDTDPTRQRQDFPCGPQGECASGFVCDPVLDVCVDPGSVSDADATEGDVATTATDTGTSDGGQDDVTVADTTVADTSPGDTVVGDTGVADTAPPVDVADMTSEVPLPSCDDALPGTLRLFPHFEANSSGPWLPASHPSISPDGRLVAWETEAPLAMSDDNAVVDVYAAEITNPESPVLHHVSFDGTPRPADTRGHMRPFVFDGGALWETEGGLDPDAETSPKIFQWRLGMTRNVVSLGVDARKPTLGGAADPTNAQIGFVTPVPGSGFDTNMVDDMYRSVQGQSNALVSVNGASATSVGLTARLARSAPRAVFTTGDASLLGVSVENVVVAEFASATTNLTIVSRDDGGQALSSPARFPRISADGSTVVYTTSASEITSGMPGALVVADVDTGSTDVLFHYVFSDAIDHSFDVSADGRFVVFSARGEFVPDVDNGHPQVYMIDRANRRIGHVSRTSMGAPGSAASQRVSLDAAGCRVAFESFASNLASADDNGTQDIFVANRPDTWYPLQ